MKITTDEAILHIYPGAEYVMSEGDINKLTFLKPDNLTVTQEQIDAAILELEQIRQAEAEAKLAAKAAAQAKLAALGLTVEDLQALSL